jgi:hypothetical protein
MSRSEEEATTANMNPEKESWCDESREEADRTLVSRIKGSNVVVKQLTYKLLGRPS